MVQVYCGLNVLLIWGLASSLQAQTNVLTYHNDNARTGQNVFETVLTPSNVNSAQFGKLYSVNVDGYVYAQPLVVSNVSISGGTHNVVYVATENDSLYAIDADNGSVLWQTSFINSGSAVPSSDTGCGDLVPQIGITGTPVIDPSTGTIYLVAKTKENGSYVQKLHAIDIATHAEKFGGPVPITGSVAQSSGTGSISFNPLNANQRAGLLLQNGHVIIAWGSHCDNLPFRGWIMSYNAGTLAQEAMLCPVRNPNTGGILTTAGGTVWMGGAGIAADGNNIYPSTGNGAYNGSTDYGDTILKLSGPSTGSFAIADWFTPWDEANLNTSDGDLGSGGVLLLPDLPSGLAHQQLLVQAGKAGTIYLIDRNNMGKYCSSCSATSGETQIVQEIPNANPGVWGMPAYWNGSVYFGGAYDGSPGDTLKAFSFNANNTGLLSTSPTSHTAQVFNFSGPTPSVSANGNTNGILWALENSTYASGCCQVLHAYNATNLATELYNTNQASNNRDLPGGAVKFTVPTVANGKVYVGSQATFSIYGLLSVAATPTFSPGAGTYNSTQSVTISDSSPGTTIYYTINGTTPTTASSVYSGPISVSATTTIKAIAAGGGFSASAVASATYTIGTPAATPTFSPVAGTYSSTQSVSISDTSTGTTIYYTTNGTTPTTSSTPYSGPISVSTTTTIKAIAAGGSFSASAVGSAGYTITQSAAATPTFSPTAGTYKSPQWVTISDISPGTTIYYTTNGTTPTTSSTAYTGAIRVNKTTTFKAIAAGSSFSASAVGSAGYTFKH